MKIKFRITVGIIAGWLEKVIDGIKKYSCYLIEERTM